MSFMSLINQDSNIFIHSLALMKKNGYPIVLTGAGCLAQMTLDFMDREALNVNHIAVNDAWLTTETRLNGRQVESLESLASLPTPHNYIVALQYVTPELRALLAKNGAEVLIFDPSFIGVNTCDYLTYEYVDKHQHAFASLYEQLGDDRSRQTLIAFLNQRISARHGAYADVFEPIHYFPADLITFKENEIFIDCGAYNGDSIAAFLKALRSQGISQAAGIIAFEPDEKNYQALVKNTASVPNCRNVKKGVWSSDTTLYFSSGLALSSKLSEQVTEESIELAALDSIVKDEKVTFIKMDVEGAELEALKGASHILQNHRPVLAISVYHKPDDLLAIPAYIQSVNENYRFYLRAHHPLHAFELVLYALPA
ncbi:FkbM family methyltransferase [Pantoea latae]|uniref:Methyltransferase FkbM domain-containing protein n=1 Tax=Pantoea latae TaxID=1964541 RepID=A0A1V9DJK8_9GAMM|nr:FkbM family methyltransferase [Pantoea latae]OQP33965.1 hypothetical protein B2J69_10340 [Pantoea latae]